MSEKEIKARPREEQRRAKPLARELWNAVVWKEVLDKPLARRGPRSR